MTTFTRHLGEPLDNQSGLVLVNSPICLLLDDKDPARAYDLSFPWKFDEIPYPICVMGIHFSLCGTNPVISVRAEMASLKLWGASCGQVPAPVGDCQ